MDKIQQQREHFNSVAERYHEARQDANHLLLKQLIWSNFLGPHHELKQEGLQTLEAMCGYGDGKNILESTLGVTIDYQGFDYSDEVIETVNQEMPELKIFHGDAGTIELDQEYDLIILLGGLHHVPHIADKVVERLCKAIKPGGHFINLEPTSGNRLFTAIRERIYERNSLFDEETERAFGVEELFGMFENAGMTLKDVTYPGLLSYVLYYNPDAFPWLNVGGSRTVRTAFALDKLFIRSTIGKIFSFATLSLWTKPKA